MLLNDGSPNKKNNNKKKNNKISNDMGRGVAMGVYGYPKISPSKLLWGKK